MSKLPIRTLTVCEGRDTIGFINEMGERQFVAFLAATGEQVGFLFKTAADAAQAINAQRNGHTGQGGRF